MVNATIVRRDIAVIKEKAFVYYYTLVSTHYIKEYPTYIS